MDLDERSEHSPDSAEPTPPAVSYAMLVLPVAVGVFLLTLFFFFVGGDAALEVLTTAAVTMTVAGKFVVLRGLHDGGFFDSPYKLALLVVYLDLTVAFVAIYNLPVLYRIPKFGAKLNHVRVTGEKILALNPWMRKVTFFGVVAFVMFPLSGTGAIGGALFGRLLGMSRPRTLIAIGIGAVFGAFGMAALAVLFKDRLEDLQDNPVLSVGGLVIVVVVIYWLVRRYKKMAAEVQSADADDAKATDTDTGPHDPDDAPD